jgi:succinate dehydrogenase / fumarate reductase cytochrome b subunit
MAVAKSARAGGKAERPLSPHLQIYSPLINMMMSIVHRITGAALYFGSLLLAWWLIAVASGPVAFDYFSAIAGSVFGRLILLGFSWALIHHALGGIRHFIWDTGLGYDLKTIDLLSWGTLALSLLLTIIVWSLALGSPFAWLGL